MASYLATSLLLAAIMVIAVKISLGALKRKSGPLPPGPKGWPIVGNISDFPKPDDRVWEHWLKHKDTYGPISSVTLFGSTFVILHSAELTSQLFDKKSSTYSSRPRFIFPTLCRLDEIFSFVPYNRKVKSARKIMHTTLGTERLVGQHLPLQEKETHRFLLRVLQDPDDLFEHLKVEAAAIILKMVYGYTVDPHKPDPLVGIVDAAMDRFSQAFLAGGRLVDIIPALQYVPDWVPGTGWKQTAKEWRAEVSAAVDTPLNFSRKRQALGNLEPSMAADFYSDKNNNKMTTELENDFRSAAASAYFGGSDTTVIVLSCFFFNMILNPDIQRKAQEEIHQVIGNGRLPDYSDKESLPYVSAVVKESFRWHTVVPMAAPHATETDDVVDGYFIPKGTSLMPNVWWFTHDPAVYSDPSEFKPSRFLGPTPDPDPAKFVFGYGRRICSGRYLALSSAWLTIARVLAVFDVSKGVDENGNEVDPPLHYGPGMVTRIEPFKVTIKSRSPEHEALIRQAEELYPWEPSDSGELELGH
ncbi:cytochrome protein [Nemania sp. NC0429]|nr:cytochrome protein [Nemania sp. NC0429]